MTAQLTPSLYAWEHDFGRMGVLDASVVIPPAVLMAIVGVTACFGEVLGKHSYISYVISLEDFRHQTSNHAFIAQAEELGLISGGHDPTKCWAGQMAYARKADVEESEWRAWCQYKVWRDSPRAAKEPFTDTIFRLLDDEMASRPNDVRIILGEAFVPILSLALAHAPDSGDELDELYAKARYSTDMAAGGHLL